VEILYLTIVLVTTWFVFPGVVLDQTFTIFEEESLWQNITLVTIYNVFDTLGRIMGQKYPINFTTRKILSWLRILQVFFLIYLVINKQALFTFTGDIIKLLNIAVLAFGSGYLFIICAIAAPYKMPKDEQEHVGIIVAIFINFSMLLGSAL
jgi:hypothetical protein